MALPWIARPDWFERRLCGRSFPQMQCKGSNWAVRETDTRYDATEFWVWQDPGDSCSGSLWRYFSLHTEPLGVHYRRTSAQLDPGRQREIQRLPWETTTHPSIGLRSTAARYHADFRPRRRYTAPGTAIPLVLWQGTQEQSPPGEPRTCACNGGDHAGVVRTKREKTRRQRNLPRRIIGYTNLATTQPSSWNWITYEQGLCWVLGGKPWGTQPGRVWSGCIFANIKARQQERAGDDQSVDWRCLSNGMIVK